MTSSPSQLADRHHTLVLDAGAVLNLLATGRAAEIAAAVGRLLFVEPSASAYLPTTRDSAQVGPAALADLARVGAVTVRRLDDHGYATFLDLVGAVPPDDLGDGEAAAIALAVACGGTMVIDGGKAARVAETHLGTPSLHTLDLLAAPAVSQALGHPGLVDAISGAIAARMRVPPTFRAWVEATMSSAGRQRADDKPVGGWSKQLSENNGSREVR